MTVCWGVKQPRYYITMTVNPYLTVARTFSVMIGDAWYNG